MENNDVILIEICKNYRGSYEMRVGTIAGSVNNSNYTKDDILKEIEIQLEDLEKNNEVDKHEK